MVLAGPLVLESSRKALRLRYQLMPMLYTAFAEVREEALWPQLEP